MNNNLNEQTVCMERLDELWHVIDIIRRAISVIRKMIIGVQYHIVLYTDASDKNKHLLVKVFG